MQQHITSIWVGISITKTSEVAFVLFQSKKCTTSDDYLCKKEFSCSDFETTAANLVHETQEELLGVAVGLGEQPFYKYLPVKSFEER